MSRWAIGMALLLAGLAVPSVDAQAQRTLSPTLVIQQACGASSDLCLNRGLQAVADTASIQRVILLGCLAEFSADPSAESKARAADCMLIGAESAAALSAPDLLAGQSQLRKMLPVHQNTDDAFTVLVRSTLLSLPEDCGDIKHIHTRYNCLIERLYRLTAGN